VWATAEIDCCDAERLVHRHDEITSSVDASPRTNCFGNCLAKADAYIFNRVVLIDVQITESLDLQVESAVAGDQLEHVVKESDTCGDAVTALSFETDSYGDFCFGGMPFDDCASHACNAC
tara:strand:- start:3556 stop:3915 length:360 start_codon:yes stop_codon:yes gene_type:complete